MQHIIFRPLHGLLLALVSGALACSPAEPLRKAVVVSLTYPVDLSVLVSAVRATGTLDGKPSTSGPQDLGAAEVPFTLLLPPGSAGRLVVSIEAAADGALALAEGQAEVAIGEADEYTLTVPLTRVPCTEWCYDDPANRDLELHAVWGSSENDVWVVGAEGTVLRWDGFAWRALEVPTLNGLFSVWGSGPGRVWIGGAGGLLLAWDGAAFTKLETDSTGDIGGLWGSGAQQVWAATGSPTLLLTEGQRVSSVRPDGMTYFYSVWGSGATDIWAVGSAGGEGSFGASRFDGAMWIPATLPLSRSGSALRGVSGSGPADVWAVGTQGTILHFDGQWTQVQGERTDRLNAVWSAGSAEAWAVGDGGRLLRWKGGPWVQYPAPTGVALYGVWGSAPQAVWAVGEHGTVLRFDGQSWSVVLSGSSGGTR